MPALVLNDSSQTVIPAPAPSAPVTQNSERQVNMFSLGAAQAESNIKGDGSVDLGSVFSNNKTGVINNQEQNIRDNIAQQEQQANINSLKEEFSNTVLTGNPTDSERVVDLAKHFLNNPQPDAVEFNALDSFRKDINPQDSADALDHTQALLASSALDNHNQDAKQVSGNDSLSHKAAMLAVKLYAANKDQSITESLVKGTFNGLSQAFYAAGKTINELLPKSYYAALNSNDPEGLKKAVLAASNVSKPFDTGIVGDAASSVSKFVFAGAAATAVLPEVAATGLVGGGLTAARTILGFTIGGVATEDHTDSAAKALEELSPTLSNDFFNYLAERPDESYYSNIFKSSVENLIGNTIGEVAAKAVLGTAKVLKTLNGTKSSILPFKDTVDDLIKTGTSLGDRQGAAAMTEQMLTGDTALSPIIKTVLKPEQAVEAATPSLMKTPLDSKPEVGIAGDVQAEFNSKEALKQVQELVAQQPYHEVNRLSHEELGAAISATKERVIGLYGEHGTLDITVNPENGVNVVSVFIGKKTGGGFETAGLAAKAAKQFNAEVKQGLDGAFYAVKKHAVQEVGYVDSIPLDQVHKIISNPAAQVVLDPNNYLPDNILEDINLAYHSKSAIRKSMVNPILKRYMAVTKEEFGHLNNIAAMGRDSIVQGDNSYVSTGKWYTPEEFRTHYVMQSGKEPSAKVLDAYKAFRELNDLQYTLENNAEFVRKARAGWEEINSTHPNLNFKGHGIIKNDLSAAVDNYIYHVDEAKIYKPGELSRDTNVPLEEKYPDHRIIKLENDTTLPDGNISKYILINKNDFNSSIIDPRQVSYRPGGRVIYAGKYFTKQARIDVMQDGSKVNRNPLTHYTSQSRQELVEHSTKLENARNAYNSALENKDYREVIGYKKDGTPSYSPNKVKLTIEEADKIIADTAMGNTDNMTKLIEEGSIRADTPFEVRGDKELPVEYNKNAGAASFIDDNHSGQSSWLMTNKRNKFKARGDRLLNPQEEAAQVLSPYQTIERSIQSIINTGMANSYVTRISEQFAATAREYGFLKPEYETASAAKIFYAGDKALKPPINGATDKNYQSLLAVNKAIRGSLGYKSERALLLDAQLKDFGEYLDKKGIQFITDDKGTKGRRVPDLADINPLRAANTFMYHTNFSFFANHQFFTQGIGGYLTTATQSPIKATQALASSPAIATYFFREDSAIALSKNTTLMKLIGFDNGESYLKFCRNMEKAGYVDVTGSHIDLARQKYFTGKKGVTFDLLDKAFESSSLPIRTGEALNQMIGYRVAYERFQEQFPKLNPDASANTAWIIREAQKITFNMNAPIKREANNSIVSIPLKYKNFAIQVVESMTVGQKFTPAQKASFWGATVGMFGLGAHNYINNTLDKIGITDPKEQFIFNNGMLNYMLSEATDGNFTIDLSGQMAPQGGLTDLVTQLLNTDQKFWPIVGGSLYSKIQQFGDKGGKAIDILQSMNGQPLDDKFRLTQHAASEMGKVISSWNNYSKGQIAFDSGQVFTNTGQPIVDGISNSTAIAMMLGFQEQSVNNYYRIIAPQVHDIIQNDKDVANAVTYFTQKAMDQDVSTEAGRASYDDYFNIVQYLTANQPNIVDIQKRVKGNLKSSITPTATKAAETLEQFKDNLRQGQPNE